MDLNKANELSSAQITIFVISSQISFGILTIATSLAEDIGHDGWISMLLSGLSVCVLIYILTALLRRFQNMSILDINKLLFGKYVGNLVNCFLIFKLTYTSIMALAMFTVLIRISVLNLTPGIAIAIFIMVPVVYLSWYGLKYICRFASMKPLLLVIIVLYYFLLAKYFRFTFLMPVGAVVIMPIIKSAYAPYLSYMGFEMLGIIYPHIKNKKDTFKYAIYGNLITIAFYCITVIFLTGFFGEEMLKQLQFPIFSLARAYRAPVLERLDLFFITLWFPIMITVLMMYYYNGYYCLRKLLKFENSKKKSKLLIFIYTILIIILSRLPKDMIQLLQLFDIIGYLTTAYISYIVFCYFISFFKKGGKKDEKAN